MMKTRRVRIAGDICSEANSSKYTNLVYRQAMALEAGAESHATAIPFSTYPRFSPHTDLHQLRTSVRGPPRFTSITICRSSGIRFSG